MKIEITILTDNDAFTPEPGLEVGRILRDLAARVETFGLQEWMLRDSNGNQVGEVHVCET
jgi:hypothetical protein